MRRGSHNCLNIRSKYNVKQQRGREKKKSSSSTVTVPYIPSVPPFSMKRGIKILSRVRGYVTDDNGFYL
jgi:hypothetical protein